MRLGIVSDTHGRLESTRQAIVMLESLDVDEVLHCGDVGCVEVMDLFRRWPCHFVAGNCDYDHSLLRLGAEALGMHWHGEFGELERAGKRIALLHSHDQQRFRDVVTSGAWDLVCYGHTHVAASDQHGPTLVLNPGALHRANPYSLAIVDLPELTAHHVTL
ncbi:MAG: YfcE family phosphodiesterase [Planctomycetales bacterium]|nr:YfcE family phosphodiesterase [Planctomycetales bacterium]